MSTMEAERQKPNYLPQPHPSVCECVFVCPIQRRFGADDVILCIRAGLWMSDDIIDSSGKEKAEMLRTEGAGGWGGGGRGGGHPEILLLTVQVAQQRGRYTKYHRSGTFKCYFSDGARSH